MTPKNTINFMWFWYWLCFISSCMLIAFKASYSTLSVTFAICLFIGLSIHMKTIMELA